MTMDSDQAVRERYAAAAREREAAHPRESKGHAYRETRGPCADGGCC